MSERKSIVIVLSSKIHLDLFERFCKKIKEDPRFNLVFFPLTSYYQIFHPDISKDISSLFPFDFIEKRQNKKIKTENIFIRLLTIFICKKECKNIFLNIMQQYKPQLVILGNDSGHLERSIISSALRKNIPTLLVQDGFLSDPFEKSMFPKTKYWIKKFWISLGGRALGFIPYGMGGTSFIAAYGRSSEEIFSKIKNSSCKVKTIGHPKFQLSQKKELHFSKRVVFFCTNYLSGENNKKMHHQQIAHIKQCFSFFKKEDGFEFKIKLHPSESKKDYLELHHMDWIESSCLEKIIEDLWLGVTHFSSVAMDCLFLNRLCLMIRMDVDRKYQYVFDRVPGFQCRSWQEWESAVEMLKDKEVYSNILEQQHLFLKNYIEQPEMCGADRLASWIQEITE